MDDDVSVKELIHRISEDLLESEQERTADGRRAVFEVAELEIELSFVVSRSRQGSAGIDLKVVSVGGQADRGDERTQRMTLRLVAAGSSGEGVRESESRSPADRAAAATTALARKFGRQLRAKSASEGEGLARLDYDDALPVRPRLGRHDGR